MLAKRGVSDERRRRVVRDGAGAARGSPAAMESKRPNLLVVPGSSLAATTARARLKIKKSAAAFIAISCNARVKLEKRLNERKEAGKALIAMESAWLMPKRI